MAIYVKIDGIEGDVTAKGYEGCFEATSLSHEVNRVVVSEPGRVENRQAGRPTIDSFRLTKSIDKTTPLLHAQSAYSQPKASATIYFVKTDSTLSAYLTYTLSDAYISHYHVNAASDEKQISAIEHIELNPVKFEAKYTPRDSQGNTKTPIAAGYDLETAQSC